MWSLKSLESASSPSNKSISSGGGSNKAGSLTLPFRQHLEKKFGFLLLDSVLSSIQCNAPHEEHLISILPKTTVTRSLLVLLRCFFRTIHHSQLHHKSLMKGYSNQHEVQAYWCC